jgi:hypothetical protein
MKAAIWHETRKKAFININVNLFDTKIGKRVVYYANSLYYSRLLLVALPAALIAKWRLRKNKELQQILSFSALKSAKSNIEKSSFAYDVLLFKENPLAILKHKTYLANLVTLAIIFADEFIDGIAQAYGKHNVLSLLNKNRNDFYLQNKKTLEGYELLYSCDFSKKIPEYIMKGSNAKYNITYYTFYNHLLFILSHINKQLNKFSQKQQQQAAGIICNAVNKSFETYIYDLQCQSENLSYNELLQYQQTKDEDILQLLLELRAVLLKKTTCKYTQQFKSWAMMLRSMQLYDDLDDAANDLNFQPNICNWYASNYYLNEYHWLCQHKASLTNMTSAQRQALIIKNMPKTYKKILEQATQIHNKYFNWVQHKIIDYLWNKNWFGLQGKKEQQSATAPNYDNLGNLDNQIISQYQIA